MIRSVDILIQMDLLEISADLGDKPEFHVIPSPSSLAIVPVRAAKPDAKAGQQLRGGVRTYESIDPVTLKRNRHVNPDGPMSRKARVYKASLAAM